MLMCVLWNLLFDFKKWWESKKIPIYIKKGIRMKIEMRTSHIFFFFFSHFTMTIHGKRCHFFVLFSLLMAFQHAIIFFEINFLEKKKKNHKNDILLVGILLSNIFNLFWMHHNLYYTIILYFPHSHSRITCNVFGFIIIVI